MQSSKALFTAANAAWLAGYIALVSAVVVAAFAARRSALDPAERAASLAEWNRWRADVKHLNESGPVRRREPASAEPPEVVLLRDCFGVVLGGAVVLSTVLYGVLMVMFRGAIGRATVPHSTEKD
jgi:hypothetical protein